MKLHPQTKSAIIASFRVVRQSMGTLDLADKAAAQLVARTYGAYGVQPEDVIALAFFGPDDPRTPAKAEGARVIQMPLRREIA